MCFGGGTVCEIVNHQGHQGPRRKYLTPKGLVILRALVVQDFIGFIVKLQLTRVLVLVQFESCCPSAVEALFKIGRLRQR
jgi:hypothetical protein